MVIFAGYLLTMQFSHRIWRKTMARKRKWAAGGRHLGLRISQTHHRQPLECACACIGRNPKYASSISQPIPINAHLLLASCIHSISTVDGKCRLTNKTRLIFHLNFNNSSGRAKFGSALDVNISESLWHLSGVASDIAAICIIFPYCAHMKSERKYRCYCDLLLAWQCQQKSATTRAHRTEIPSEIFPIRCTLCLLKCVLCVV